MPLICGSVLRVDVLWTALIEPSSVSALDRLSGERVSMSTEPVAPPSIRSACAVLYTVTLPTISAGSRS